MANVAVQSGPQHGDMLPGTPVTSLPIGGDQWRQERHLYVLNTTDVSKMRSSGPPRAATSHVSIFWLFSQSVSSLGPGGNFMKFIMKFRGFMEVVKFHENTGVFSEFLAKKKIS